MIVVTNDGKVWLLGNSLGKTTPSPEVCYHWFTNDYHPVDTTVRSDLSEVDAGVAAPFFVPKATWNLSLASDTAVAQEPQRTVVVHADTTLYGYFVTPDTDFTLVIWLERFVPLPLIFTGPNLFKITPYLSEFMCNPGYFSRPYFG